MTIKATAKADQSITFGALSNKTYGDSSFALTATASSGLGVSYTSSDTNVASISGSTVTILKAGTTTITASQSGNDNYNAAVSVPQTLTVAKASQSISFVLDPASGTAGTTRTLSGSATSLLPVAYESSNPGIASMSGSTLNLVAVGTTTITASQAGNENYEAAALVSQGLTVTSADSGFTTWNSGNASMTPELLLKYAIGGATNSTAASEQPTTSLTPTLFSLTAVVRTDDPKLTITPKATTSLGSTWNYPVTTAGALQSVNQANVPVGCERKVFTLDRSTNTKVFIKLETGYTP
jgi:hypothetical protein